MPTPVKEILSALQKNVGGSNRSGQTIDGIERHALVDL